MHLEQFNQDFFSFLSSSPTPFHAVKYISDLFQKNGFKQLFENRTWDTRAGEGYYCVRDNGTIIGIKLAKKSAANAAWRMTGAHTDSPALQLKPIPVRDSNSTTQLCVEVYGGPLLATWFDRDLGIAGRVMCSDEKGTILTCLIDFKRPVAIIPSLAIHLDRDANKEHTVKRQKHLYPLLCHSTNGQEKTFFNDVLLQQIKLEHPDLPVKNILGFDLFCYDTQPPTVTGVHNDFITAGRLDNLVSCFVSAKSLLQNQINDNCLMLCSNHEEIGSSSMAGARGNFLSTVLSRLIPEASDRNMALHDSYFLSLDNAHGVHPNFPEKHDPQHLPLLNHGPVIKYNSNQRYATTSKSAALYKMLASEVDVPVQEFVMNNDLTCGSTIGPIAATNLGIQTVDIGIPSLAMHSIRETSGVKDPYMLYQTISHFYSRSVLPQTEE
ncbi:MAG TPA: M18 family aminopeptidase [Desulfobacterales bacterium]|nr:M18 family aminopeptidase [Desulfobacterales bacterium]HIP39684.1 M18 family aminopeptidase [Desulfocapsa sulfexigens]